jgi:hypothetical protein
MPVIAVSTKMAHKDRGPPQHSMGTTHSTPTIPAQTGGAEDPEYSVIYVIYLNVQALYRTLEDTYWKKNKTLQQVLLEQVPKSEEKDKLRTSLLLTRDGELIRRGRELDDQNGNITWAEIDALIPYINTHIRGINKYIRQSSQQFKSLPTLRELYEAYLNKENEAQEKQKRLNEILQPGTVLQQKRTLNPLQSTDASKKSANERKPFVSKPLLDNNLSTVPTTELTQALPTTELTELTQALPSNNASTSAETQKPQATTRAEEIGMSNTYAKPSSTGETSEQPYELSEDKKIDLTVFERWNIFGTMSGLVPIATKVLRNNYQNDINKAKEAGAKVTNDLIEEAKKQPMPENIAKAINEHLENMGITKKTTTYGDVDKYIPQINQKFQGTPILTIQERIEEFIRTNATNENDSDPIGMVLQPNSWRTNATNENDSDPIGMVLQPNSWRTNATNENDSDPIGMVLQPNSWRTNPLFESTTNAPPKSDPPLTPNVSLSSFDPLEITDEDNEILKPAPKATMQLNWGIVTDWIIPSSLPNLTEDSLYNQSDLNLHIYMDITRPLHTLKFFFQKSKDKKRLQTLLVAYLHILRGLYIRESFSSTNNQKEEKKVAQMRILIPVVLEGSLEYDVQAYSEIVKVQKGQTIMVIKPVGTTRQRDISLIRGKYYDANTLITDIYNPETTGFMFPTPANNRPEELSNMFQDIIGTLLGQASLSEKFHTHIVSSKQNFLQNNKVSALVQNDLRNAIKKYGVDRLKKDYMDAINIMLYNLLFAQ